MPSTMLISETLASLHWSPNHQSICVLALQIAIGSADHCVHVYDLRRANTALHVMAGKQPDM